jgi:hypothetical protein
MPFPRRSSERPRSYPDVRVGLHLLWDAESAEQITPAKEKRTRSEEGGQYPGHWNAGLSVIKAIKAPLARGVDTLTCVNRPQVARVGRESSIERRAAAKFQAQCRPESSPAPCGRACRGDEND